VSCLESKVALVELNEDIQESFKQALKLIGKIDDLNTKDRNVVIKLGVFDHKKKNHPTVDVVNAIIDSFNKAPKIFLAESDNYKGKGSERLQIWKTLFTERVMPFNLSEDTDTRETKIADEKIALSHVLFKPNILVSTHALRKSDVGTILKNLLGLIPDRRKMRFHKKLERTLLDLYEAVRGIDLAVIDAIYTYSDLTLDKGLNTNVLVVGRDAVAVEAVGAILVGLDPKKMLLIQEAVKRGLGEGDIEKIRILGKSLESLRERFQVMK